MRRDSVDTQCCTGLGGDLFRGSEESSGKRCGRRNAQGRSRACRRHPSLSLLLASAPSWVVLRGRGLPFVSQAKQKLLKGQAKHGPQTEPRSSKIPRHFKSSLQPPSFRVLVLWGFLPAKSPSVPTEENSPEIVRSPPKQAHVGLAIPSQPVSFS